MTVDDAVRRVMIKALRGNLAYQPHERVILVTQRWDPVFGEEARGVIGRSEALCRALRDTYAAAGIDVELLTYVPEAAQSGVNPTDELFGTFEEYEERKGVPEIVIAPAAYSITHTDWRKGQNAKGSRIATMSNSSLAMFVPGGPFDFQGDYKRIVQTTLEVAEKLRSSDYVHIAGPDTDLVINIDRELVHAGTGYVSEPGESDNWLGAEAYAVPVHGGRSFGWFKTPAGWGGARQLRHDTTFFIANGRFAAAEPTCRSAEARAWVDENVKPRLFGKPGYDVVAELGIGTNSAVSVDYLMENWSIAVGEKKGDTVHIAHGNSAAMGGVNRVDMHEDFVIPSVTSLEFNYGF